MTRNEPNYEAGGRLPHLLRASSIISWEVLGGGGGAGAGGLGVASGGGGGFSVEPAGFGDGGGAGIGVTGGGAQPALPMAGPTWRGGA